MSSRSHQARANAPFSLLLKHHSRHSMSPASSDCSQGCSDIVPSSSAYCTSPLGRAASFSICFIPFMKFHPFVLVVDDISRRLTERPSHLLLSSPLMRLCSSGSVTVEGHHWHGAPECTLTSVTSTNFLLMFVTRSRLSC